jgi:hypothetical protein
VMQLALERCTIRDWRLDDAASLAKYANNHRVWLGLPLLADIQDRRQHFHVLRIAFVLVSTQQWQRDMNKRK